LNRHSTLHQAYTLNYAFVASNGLADVKCTVCKGLMDTHQPDPNQPERILGTCPGCGTWYLIDSYDDGKKLLILQLPDPATIPHATSREVKT
jgi:hypothetical protein